MRRIVEQYLGRIMIEQGREGHQWTCLLTHVEERNTLGRQGLAYVDREYRWPTVLARVERVLAAVVAANSSARASHPSTEGSEP